MVIYIPFFNKHSVEGANARDLYSSQPPAYRAGWYYDYKHAARVNGDTTYSISIHLWKGLLEKFHN